MVQRLRDICEGSQGESQQGRLGVEFFLHSQLASWDRRSQHRGFSKPHLGRQLTRESRDPSGFQESSLCLVFFHARLEAGPLGQLLHSLWSQRPLETWCMKDNPVGMLAQRVRTRHHASHLLWMNHHKGRAWLACRVIKLLLQKIGDLWWPLARYGACFCCQLRQYFPEQMRWRLAIDGLLNACWSRIPVET